MRRADASLLPSLSFFLGVFSLLAQVILVREFFVVFTGSELNLGLVLAAWLLWNGAGSLVGGRLLANLPAGVSRERLLLFLPTAAALAVPVTILLIRSLRVWAPVGTGELLAFRSTALLTFALLGGTGLLFGLWFTLAASLPSDSGSGPGRTYAWEAAGGLAAGAIFSFFLAERTEGLLFGCALSLLAAAVSLWMFPSAGVGTRRLLRACALAGAVGAGLLGMMGNDLLSPWIRQSQSWRWPGMTMIDSRDSRYGNLTLIGVGNQMTLYENGSPGFSFPDPLAASEAVHLPLLAAASQKSVLLIGGGLGGGLAEILRYPVERLDYLELDPGALDIVRSRLPAPLESSLRDPRLRILHEDGRSWLGRHQRLYDVIIVNLPPPASALVNRFYTREFFLLARENLERDGLLALSLPASPNYFGEALRLRNGSVFQTLLEVFPSVAAVPAGRNLLFATTAPRAPDLSPERIGERIESLGVGNDYLRPQAVAAYLDPGRIAYLRGELISSPAAANRDLSPAAYYYTTFFWSRLSDPSLAPWLKAVLGPARLLPFLLPAAALLAGLFIVRSSLSPGFPAGLAAFSSGLSAMACQYLILFVFQTARGTLYRQIGILNGAFMAGLAAGGFLCLRLRKKSSTHRRLLLTVETALLFWPLAMGAVLQLLPAGAFDLDRRIPVDASFILLSAGTGLLVGFQFPLFTLMHRDARTRAGPLGGRFYFLDLAGSALGVLLASLWLLPLTGMWGTLVLCAAFKFASLAVLAARRT